MISLNEVNIKEIEIETNEHFEKHKAEIKSKMDYIDREIEKWRNPKTVKWTPSKKYR